MKIRIFLAASAFFLGIVTAHAQSTVVQQNTDGTTTTTTYYFNDDFDKNNNGILDSDEFNTYVYSRWDTNRDGYLSDAEWERSLTRWSRAPQSVEYKTYSYWDKDGDGRLDPAEFNTVVSSTRLYQVWDEDADNIIEADEYANATFRLYDLNGDGHLSMDEWKTAD